MKRIVLTGGGTAGHVTPNLALIPGLRHLNYDISYIGSYEGIEKKLLADLDIPYYGISSGKLRRYMALKNLSDPFRVVKGYFEARKLLKKLSPDIVFSKGGFVTVPVVTAAKHLKIPVIIHESDMTPGLANRLAIPSAVKVCCNFPETLEYLPKEKAVLTGSPIRKELFEGNPAAAKAFCGFTDDKPTLMIIGGSLGAVVINDTIRMLLPKILTDFNVIHLCGKGNLSKEHASLPGYVQFEYIKKELADLFALADVLISRAGANAICEISALAKPNLLIPLAANASRGDQILNAASFEKQGFSMVLRQEDLTCDTLCSALYALYENREQYRRNMQASTQIDAVGKILELIEQHHR